LVTYILRDKRGIHLCKCFLLNSASKAMIMKYIYIYLVRFEVLTAVAMKSSIFWDIMLCSVVIVKPCFGRMYRLHLQILRVSQARNQYFSACCLLHAGFSLGLLFKP
jgi:hypothetical protein